MICLSQLVKMRLTGKLRRDFNILAVALFLHAAVGVHIIHPLFHRMIAGAGAWRALFARVPQRR
ncbi:MAG: hypothetical protein J7M19_06425 [Planctomycetes bacterium]|nr:hypothetical protein [Planctomycetota bacterium]